ncbi:MAG: hypothetical protein ACRC1M_01865 [Methanobacteriaceae archaeon]
MLTKKICILTLMIFVTFLCISCVNATTYSISNSMDSVNISKMVSGNLPMKEGIFIKNGDIIKFKAGNYYNLNLNIKKSINLTTNKKEVGKVNFIGNGTRTCINIKSSKVTIQGVKIKNYDFAISGKTSNSYFSKITLYSSKFTLSGNSNRVYSNNFILSSFDVNGRYNKIYSNKISDVVTIMGYKNFVKNNLLNKSSITANGNENVITYNKAYKSDITINGKLNKVNYNKIFSARTTGIGVYGLKNVVSENSVFKAQNGIDINGNKHSIIKNTISNCRYGIIYQDKNNIFKKNTFKNNKKNTWYNPPIFPE